MTKFCIATFKLLATFTNCAFIGFYMFDVSLESCTWERLHFGSVCSHMQCIEFAATIFHKSFPIDLLRHHQ